MNQSMIETPYGAEESYQLVREGKMRWVFGQGGKLKLVSSDYVLKALEHDVPHTNYFFEKPEVSVEPLMLSAKPSNDFPEVVEARSVDQSKLFDIPLEAIIEEGWDELTSNIDRLEDSKITSLEKVIDEKDREIKRLQEIINKLDSEVGTFKESLEKETDKTLDDSNRVIASLRKENRKLKKVISRESLKVAKAMKIAEEATKSSSVIARMCSKFIEEEAPITVRTGALSS